MLARDRPPRLREQMFDTVVLGVDPGVAQCGLGVVGRRDRRTELVWADTVLTPAGEEVLLELMPGVSVHYQGIMSSLEPAEQKEFMRLLRKFVHLYDQQNKPEVRKARAADAA